MAFDPDAYLAAAPKTFDPDAYLASKKPAAPFIPESPPSLGSAIGQGAKEVGAALASPVVSAWNALGAVGDAALHPVRTFQGSPLARAVGASTPEAVARHDAEQREVMRGVNGNFPYANTAVEQMGGPPAESAEDAAAAPGASDVGGFAGAPLAGEIAGNLVERGVGAAAKAGEASIARSDARGPGAVNAATKEAYAEVKKHAHEIATAAVADAVIGHGHGIAATTAALKVGKPVAKAAGVAADEGLAAVARKFKGAGVPTVTEAPPVAAPVPESLPPPGTPASSVEAVPAPAPEVAPAASVAPPVAPPAPVPPPVVADVLQPNIPARKPAWEPSRADPAFAKKLGMTTERYREMMTKTTPRMTAKDVERVKVAKLIRLVSDRHSAKSIAAAAEEAISAGADPHVIQRITTEMTKRAVKGAMTDAP